MERQVVSITHLPQIAALGSHHYRVSKKETPQGTISRMEELTEQLRGMVMDTAAGMPTKSEALGHKEFFIPYKYQERQVAFPKACE